MLSVCYLWCFFSATLRNIALVGIVRQARGWTTWDQIPEGVETLPFVVKFRLAVGPFQSRTQKLSTVTRQVRGLGTHHHLVLLRMRGALLPLLHTSLWSGAWVRRQLNPFASSFVVTHCVQRDWIATIKTLSWILNCRYVSLCRAVPAHQMLSYVSAFLNQVVEFPPSHM
jgi:hypothetical protein